MKFFNNINKLIVIFLLLIFCFALIPFSPAKAQWAISGYPTGDQWFVSQPIKEKLEQTSKKITNTLIDSVFMGVIKGTEYILNKVAYDFAVTLASGNWGQSPLFQRKSVGNYFAGVAGDAIGTALDSFGKGIGFNLCTLPDVKLDLALKLGLHLAYSEPQPSCTWQQLKQSYSEEGLKSKYWGKDGENFAKMFNTSIKIEDTDLGVGIAAKGKIDAYVAKTERDAELARQEGSGAKPLSAMISGDILTPAEVNKDVLRGASPAARAESDKQTTAQYMGAAFTRGSVQMLKNVASTFINTLAGTMMDNFLNKGMFPFGLGKIKCVPSYLKIGGLAIDTCVESKYTAEGYYEDSRVSTYRQEAAMIFADLLVARTKSDDKYDLLSRFESCNHDESDTTENCILDQKFATYLREVDLSKRPLTIAEALESGAIDDFAIIGPNTDKSIALKNSRCFEDGYCYYNIKVLRKARVWPLGMEIVAATATGTVKLSQVIAGFSDSNSAYYKMVNPNWVLKMPKTRCKAVAYSSLTIGKDSPMRQEVCEDLQTCVGYDSKGNCNAYGYCLEEKNIWKFNADYCDSQYETCKSFTSSKGKNVTYLQKTLDTTWCDKQNSGCTFYTAYKNDQGKWAEKVSPTVSITVAMSSQTTPDFLSESGAGAFRNNYSYFFNNQVQTCREENAGCSRVFAVFNNKAERELFIKKAPDYLRCYDTDSNPDNGIQWPKNLSDLNKIRPVDSKACLNYAGICLPEEEGCNTYKRVPLSIFKEGLEETIIGKFARHTATTTGVVLNDECPASCVGYNAYKELANRYSNGNNLVYIIPKEEALCKPEEDGCSAFVNLNVTSGGNVQTEYYSNLRLCMIPDQNKQKNFYTYEGREGGGYQLISYTLLKDSNGSPKQLYRDQDEFARLNGNCSPSTAGIGECREFIDEQGKKHYAYLDKTVVASNSCTPYRAIKSEFYTGNSCLGSYGSNTADNSDRIAYYDVSSGYCIYNGLPQNIVASTQSSVACSQDKVSCRRYQGSTAYYVSTALPLQTFDNAIIGQDINRDVWGNSDANDLNTTSSISTESLTQGGRSYKVTVKPGSTAGVKRMNIKMIEGKTYKVSFLAKGQGGAWGVRIYHRLYNFQDLYGNEMNFTPTDNWRKYEFTFIATLADECKSTSHLTFRNIVSGNHALFLDDVFIQEVNDTVYLVKNKLSVPLECDSNQNDNLPGPVLGCRAYTVGSSKDVVNLHNFSYLCREEAVGCTRLADTYNKNVNIPTNTWQVFNLWLNKPSGSNKAVTSILGVEYSCIVPDGETGCYINASGIGQGAAGGTYVTSTILLYQNTKPSTTPIYLTLRKNNWVDNFCNKENVGCTLMGKGYENATGTYVFEDTYVINNPSAYEGQGENNPGTLCSQQAQGCDTWRSGSGNYYFKDPEKIGEKICVYKEVVVNNHKVGRWFLKGVKNENNEDVVCPSSWLANMPAFSAADYKGYVGECPPSQDGCTRYDDHNDISVKKCKLSGIKCDYDKDCSGKQDDVCIPSASSYYLIDNGRLTEKINETCPNGASINYGCILLDKVSDPKKLYNTQATYAASAAVAGAPVVPSQTDTKDANILAKVVRDRECNLWMYCNSYRVEDDTAKCYSFGLCSKSQPGMFAEGSCETDVPLNDWTWLNKKITKDEYRNDRGVGWSDPEFSGHILFNAFQIPSLGVRYVRMDNVEPYNQNNLVQSSGEEGDSFEPRLVHRENSGNIFVIGQGNVQECNKFDNTMTKTCGLNKEGLCLGGECIYPITGGVSDYERNREKIRSSGKLSCRGYPEQNSPFDPWGILDLGKNEATPGSKNNWIFETGNTTLDICRVTQKGQTCDCSYKKVEYSGTNFYYPLASGDTPAFICMGGENDGKPCNSLSNSETECPNGACFAKKTENEVQGWRGYCVEKDERFTAYGQLGNPCLTWWPIEVVPGAPDIWLIDRKASYEGNESKDRYMCLANQPLKLKPLPKVQFAFNANNPYGLAEIKNPKNLKIKTETTTIEVIQYCPLGGNSPEEGCLQLGGAEGGAFNINLLQSDKAITTTTVVYKEECECTSDYKKRGGCETVGEKVDKLKCTPNMITGGFCTTTEGGIPGNPFSYVSSTYDNFSCYTPTSEDVTIKAVAINDVNRYSVIGNDWVKGNQKFGLSFDMVVAGSVALIGATIPVVSAGASLMAAAVVSSLGSLVGIVAVLGIFIDWIAQSAQTVVIKHPVSSAFVYNLPLNAHILQCVDGSGKNFPLLAQDINSELKEENTRVYCSLKLNNEKTSAFQDQTVGAIEPSFYNGGLIKKSDIVKIDLVLGNNYCQLHKKGVVSFFGLFESEGWPVKDGCDNEIVRQEATGKKKFFTNNIISFENKEITGCKVEKDENCLGLYKQTQDEEEHDCKEFDDVCITEYKYSEVPYYTEGGDYRNQLVRKDSYKINNGNTVWEILALADKWSEGSTEEEVFKNPNKDNDEVTGLFYDAIPSNRGLPNQYNNFEASTYKTRLNGLGARIIWGKNDELLGAQLDLHDADKDVAGISFFFVIHFTDGSCTEFVKVSKNSIESGNTAERELDAKPVTWRLMTGKTGMGDKLHPLTTNVVYNMRANETSINNYSASIESLNRAYFQGFRDSRDFTGYFTRSDLNNPVLTTYYLTKGEEFGKYYYTDNRVKSALATYENRNAISKELRLPIAGIFPLKEVMTTQMFQKMFVKSFPTSTSSNEPKNLSFYAQRDCAAPNANCGVAIKPPIIAAPLDLSASPGLCSSFKEASGKTQCKTFVLNTPIINKTESSGNLINGTAVTVGAQADVALEFYAWADPAQMPVRRIMYQQDQGADAIRLEARSIGNRKPMCSDYGYCDYSFGGYDYKYQIPCSEKEDCVFYDAKNTTGNTMNLIKANCIKFDEKDINDPNGFGNISGKDGTGCKDTPYEFHFTYNTTPGTSFPRVQVLDNWGWCSGRCGPDNGYSYGCYADIIPNQCDPNRVSAPAGSISWIEYDGSVIVE